MLVYRVENPRTKQGPFRDDEDLIPYDSFDWKRLEIIIKGGIDYDGTDLARAPAPGQEYSERLPADLKAKVRTHPLKIVLTRDGDEFVWGCPDCKTFEFWFPKPARKILADYGYKEAIYEVPDDKVLALQTQCAFRPADAKLVKYKTVDYV